MTKLKRTKDPNMEKAKRLTDGLMKQLLIQPSPLSRDPEDAFATFDDLIIIQESIYRILIRNGLNTTEE